jgi:hypothetical protein
MNKQHKEQQQQQQQEKERGGKGVVVLGPQEHHMRESRCGKLAVYSADLL